MEPVEGRKPSELARSDSLLAAQAQVGDRQALDNLLRLYQAPLYRHIRLITRDDDFALDVLQDVLVLIVRRLSSLRNPRLFKPWAYRVATREAIRKTRRRRTLWSLTDPEEAADQVRECETPETPPLTRDELLSRVTRLPAASALVISMHYLEEMSFVEISEALSIPIGTAKSRSAYGLSLLRKTLAGDCLVADD